MEFNRHNCFARISNIKRWNTFAHVLRKFSMHIHVVLEQLNMKSCHVSRRAARERTDVFYGTATPRVVLAWLTWCCSCLLVSRLFLAIATSTPTR